MSLKIQVLSSGSCGNAALYSAGRTHVLVDCGLSARSLTALLGKAGVEPSELSGIFITHEHTDHVKGVPVFLKRRKIPLFISPACLETEPFYGAEIDTEAIEADRPVTLGPLTVTPFPVPHDAARCFGFVLEAGGVRAVHATDLGRPTALVEKRLKGAHCMLIEFNHDLDRLMAGPYPMRVKLRVRSDLGHLSNDQAGRLLAASSNGETQAVYLMHLSKENNLPALAKLAAREALGDGKVRVEVARHLVAAPAWEG